MIVLLVEKAERTTINGGYLGGMVNIEALKETLNSLKQYCENLKASISAGLQSVGESTAASNSAAKTTFETAMQNQSITIKDMEDQNVKH